MGLMSPLFFRKPVWFYPLCLIIISDFRPLLRFEKTYKKDLSGFFWDKPEGRSCSQSDLSHVRRLQVEEHTYMAICGYSLT